MEFQLSLTEDEMHTIGFALDLLHSSLHSSPVGFMFQGQHVAILSIMPKINAALMGEDQAKHDLRAAHLLDGLDLGGL